MTVAASVGEGELTLDPPFDLATSAALANNIDRGDLAENLFRITALRECAYEVTITAVAPGDGEPERREIINTSVASTHLLFALLDDVLCEIENRLNAPHPSQ